MAAFQFLGLPYQEVGSLGLEQWFPDPSISTLLVILVLGPLGLVAVLTPA